MCYQKLQTGLQSQADDLFNKHFGTIKEDAYSEYLKDYWQHLFKQELEYLRLREENKRMAGLADQKNHPFMIITLGTSLEPIVLAVYLVKPSNIFVIYNNNSHFEKFKNNLNIVKSVNGIDGFSPDVKGISLGEMLHETTEAADLFRLLRGKKRAADDGSSQGNLKELTGILNCETKRKNIVFDITGAKKTISSGCFLYAAYADIPVYYMDFESGENAYHPNLGRPYPGRCFYTRQTNPVSVFAIREFEKIERDFDDRKFHDSLTHLCEIITIMNTGKKEGYFDDNEINELVNIGRVCKIYADWQDGAYGKDEVKKNIYQRLADISNNLSIPRQFNDLAEYPSSRKGTEIYDNAYYYSKINSLCSYVTIELARLKRKEPLPNQHLFLKIFCLEEFLIGFIWWKFICNENITLDVRKRNGERISTTDSHKEEFVNSNHGQLERYLITNVDKSYRPENPHRVDNDFAYFERDSINSLFGNSDLPGILWVFRGDQSTRNYREKSKTRNKRNKAAHFTIYIDDSEVNKLLTAAENLWKYLLENKPDWFNINGESLAEEYLKLMSNENWHLKPEVAPLKYGEVRNIIHDHLENEHRSKIVDKGED